MNTLPTKVESAPPGPIPVDARPVADGSAAPRLNERQRRALAQGALRIESFQGPIPPPALLEQYEAIYPGAAGIIFGEFEQQGQHRRELESRVVRSNIRQSTLGQVLAFIILAGLAGGGVYLLSKGLSTQGFGTIAFAVASGLWALGSAQKAKQRDLSRKSSNDRKRGD